MKEQLSIHINLNYHLRKAQHGFIAGRSTTTNSIACDVAIAKCMALRHPYDIINIDFQKAFGKVPHSVILKALQSKGIGGQAIKWCGNFLFKKIQQV